MPPGVTCTRSMSFGPKNACVVVRTQASEEDLRPAAGPSRITQNGNGVTLIILAPPASCQIA